MNHYRKNERKKLKRIKAVAKQCPFCSSVVNEEGIIKLEYIYVVPNLTRYDLWENHDVTDHLLIIPKRHVKSLQELKPTERYEIIDTIAKYESQGFSVYARAPGFITRSLEHQHTHLIKTSNKKPKLAIYVARPYFLFKI